MPAAGEQQHIYANLNAFDDFSVGPLNTIVALKGTSPRIELQGTFPVTALLYVWSIDGVEIKRENSTSPELVHTFTEVGVYKLAVEVSNPAKMERIEADVAIYEPLTGE